MSGSNSNAGKKKSTNSNNGKKVDKWAKFWESEAKALRQPKRIKTEFVFDSKVLAELELYEEFYQHGLKEEISKDMLAERIISQSLENNMFFSEWKMQRTRQTGNSDLKSAANNELNLDIDNDNSAFENLNNIDKKVTV